VQAAEIWVDKTNDSLHCEYMKRLGAKSRELGANRGTSAQQCGVSSGGSAASTRYLPPVASHSARRAGSAFTLIEILLVVAVVAVLAGLTLASLGGINQKAARDRTKAEISAIANALEAYRSQHGTYPESVGTNNYVPMTNIGGFLAVEKMQVVDDVPYDPFGKPYLYRFPGKINRASFDVYSTSAAKSELDTNGWIGNW
jgi:general secretion pathway protein G